MLQDIKIRLEGATSGPWESEMNNSHAGTIATVHLNDGKGWHDIWSEDNWMGDPEMQEANAQLIINAPTDIAWLIGEVERLRKIEAEAKVITAWVHFGDEYAHVQKSDFHRLADAVRGTE